MNWRDVLMLCSTRAAKAGATKKHRPAPSNERHLLRNGAIGGEAGKPRRAKRGDKRQFFSFFDVIIATFSHPRRLIRWSKLYENNQTSHYGPRAERGGGFDRVRANERQPLASSR